MLLKHCPESFAGTKFTADAAVPATTLEDALAAPSQALAVHFSCSSLPANRRHPPGKLCFAEKTHFVWKKIE